MNFRYQRNDGLFENVWNLLEKAKEEKSSVVSEVNIEKVQEKTANGAVHTDDKQPVKTKKRKGRVQEEEALAEEEVEAIREAKRRKREAKSNPEQENVE